MPPRLHAQIASVRRAFAPLVAAGWVQFVLWDGNSVARLIDRLETHAGAGGDKMPEFARAFAQCERVIEKCDIGRLAVMHAYGGLYLDLDVTATAPGAAIYGLLARLDPRFAYASLGTHLNNRAAAAAAVARRAGFPSYENSALFAARPGHPLWWRIADQSCRARRVLNAAKVRLYAPHAFVCAATGPVLLSEVSRSVARTGGFNFAAAGLRHNYDSGWH